MQLPYCSCVRSIQANPEYLHSQHLAHVSSSLRKAGTRCKTSTYNCIIHALPQVMDVNTGAQGHICICAPPVAGP
jgi:hypothetical protein